MGGKLFSSYRTVFELAQGLHSKTSDSNCSYEALVQKEVLSSVLQKFIQLYYPDNGNLSLNYI